MKIDKSDRADVAEVIIVGAVEARDALIGLVHTPYVRVLNAMAADGVGLIFAGHTHGGQVRLPLPSWIGGSRALTTNCELPSWRSPGLSVEDGKPWLHVSAGVGTTRIRRFGLGLGLRRA